MVMVMGLFALLFHFLKLTVPNPIIGIIHGEPVTIPHDEEEDSKEHKPLVDSSTPYQE